MNNKNVCYRTNLDLKVMVNSQGLSKLELLKKEMHFICEIKNHENFGFKIRSFNRKAQKNASDNVILDKELIDKINVICVNTACTRSEVVRYLLYSACSRQ